MSDNNTLNFVQLIHIIIFNQYLRVYINVVFDVCLRVCINVVSNVCF